MAADGGLAAAARRDPGARDPELPADAAAACDRHRDRATPPGARGARAASRALVRRQDVYVSVAGGVRILEPAVDLPLALALASALRDVPLPLDVAAFGELGLTGQVRPVLAGRDAALKEASRFGMKRVLGAAPATLDRCGCGRASSAVETRRRRLAGARDEVRSAREDVRRPAVMRRRESWQNRRERPAQRTGDPVIDPKTRELLREELKKVAPGTHLREGLDMILAARQARSSSSETRPASRGCATAASPSTRRSPRSGCSSSRRWTARSSSTSTCDTIMRANVHLAARPVASHERDRHAPPHRRAREPADQGARHLGLAAPRRSSACTCAAGASRSKTPRSCSPRRTRRSRRCRTTAPGSARSWSA